MTFEIKLTSILIRILVYGTITAAIFSFGIFYVYSHPARYHSPGDPSSLGLKFESVSFASADNVILKGWLIKGGSDEKVVIAMHGYPMDKGNILGMVSFIAKDFSVFLFDFRAMGESGAFFSTAGKKEQLDLNSAIEYLKGRGFKKFGLYGFSVGAAVALLSQNHEIKARVADSPFDRPADVLHSVFSGLGFMNKPLVFCMNIWNILFSGFSIYSISSAEAVRSSTVPTLIFHGDADSTVPYSNSLAIKKANPTIQLITVHGANHGEAYFYATAKYEKEITHFFLDNLK